MKKPKKVILIGCNEVGIAFISACLNQGIVAEYGLMDENTTLKEACLLDLEDTISFLPTPLKVFGAKEEDLGNADYVFITNYRSQQTDETRISMIEHNAEMMAKIAQRLKTANFQGIVVIAADPVDVLTYAFIKHSHLNSKQIIGTGTALDSSRLQWMIANELKISLKLIHGFVLGEHADNAFVAFSSITVNNLNLNKFNKNRFTDTSYEHELEIPVLKKSYEIISRKYQPAYGLGNVLMGLLKMMIYDAKEIVSVSAFLHGEYGYEDVVISVPCVIGTNGIEQVIELNLSTKEKAKFENSYESINSYNENIREKL